MVDLVAVFVDVTNTWDAVAVVVGIIDATWVVISEV